MMHKIDLLLNIVVAGVQIWLAINIYLYKWSLGLVAIAVAVGLISLSLQQYTQLPVPPSIDKLWPGFLTGTVCMVVAALLARAHNDK